MDWLQGSALRILDDGISLLLVLDHVPEDDRLCAALACRAFRDGLVSSPGLQRQRVELMRQAGPRVFVPRATEALRYTRVMAVSASPARLHWARHLGEHPNGVVDLAATPGPTWLLNWDANTFRLLAGSNSMVGVKWARAQRTPCPWDESSCRAAAAYGNLHVLQWLRSQSCPWDYHTCAMASQNNRLDVLRWARDNGCPWEAKIVCVAAAKRGRISILNWLVSVVEADGGGVSLTGPAAREICAAAAAEGHLAVLQWARRGWPVAGGVVRIPWDARTCEGAALRGHVKVLEWARAQTPPCDWGPYTCAMAARGGHLELLQWARAQVPPCRWNTSTCAAAAAYGKLECLTWLHLNGAPWANNNISRLGAAGGHPECLRYALRNGCGTHITACADAAKGGHLECLQIAREYECHWNEWTCANAALGGHLELLKWARAQVPPCPWNTSTCAMAARGGHLELLQWARGLPEAERAQWGGSTLREAAANGHTELEEWALANGCPRTD
jgi:hypothetical protein